MLNELFLLRKNLCKIGYDQVFSHSNFEDKPAYKKKNILLRLNSQSQIDLIKFLDKEELIEWYHLWTLKNGNHSRFPLLQKFPTLIKEEVCKQIGEKKCTLAELLELLADRSNWNSPDIVRKSFSNNVMQQTDRILKWSSTNHKEEELLLHLQLLAKNFIKIAEDFDSFIEKAVCFLNKKITRSERDCDLEAYRSLILGNTSKDVQIILDLISHPKDIFGCIYSTEMKSLVQDCLKRSGSSDKNRKDLLGKNDNGICAFQHTIMPLLSDAYPQWSARPVIKKNFYPFSKNKEVNCNYRYGKAGSESFPIGKETANDLVSAACSLTAQENKTNWAGIDNGRSQNDKDLLVVYPSFPFKELELGNIFIKPDESEFDERKRRIKVEKFEKRAEDLCKALIQNVSEKELKRENLNILLFRTISDGQVQLIYSEMFSCEHFTWAIQEWRNSGKNVPPNLKVILPSHEKEKNGWYTPNLLFPANIVKLMSYQWSRDGRSAFRLANAPITDIYNMFLKKEGEWRYAAQRVLDILLERTEPLLIGAGKFLHRHSPKNLSSWNEFVHPKKKQPDPRYYLADSLSLMSSLLYIINSKPSVYMNEFSYQFGKLLAVMDELHRCYSEVKRDGHYPSGLMGNALLGCAAVAPGQTLADLLDRSRLYIGWAKSSNPDDYKEKKEAVLRAKMLLTTSESISESISKDPTKFGQEMDSQNKAYLFLGYLSRIFEEKEGRFQEQTDNNEIINE